MYILCLSRTFCHFSYFLADLIETCRWRYNYTFIQFRSIWSDDWTKKLKNYAPLWWFAWLQTTARCWMFRKLTPKHKMHVFFMNPTRLFIRILCGVVFCVRLWLFMESRLKQIPLFFIFTAYFFSFSSVFVFISTVHVFIVSTLAALWVCNLHLYIQTIKKRKVSNFLYPYRTLSNKNMLFGRDSIMFSRITRSTVLFLAAATYVCYCR